MFAGMLRLEENIMHPRVGKLILVNTETASFEGLSVVGNKLQK